ncbi:MAG: hypothetical protein Q9159_003701 [Coniocarpon cinnabarinum]
MKKSAFSCERCRERKVKCGGQQPRCSRCIARDDECQYKLNPTLLYTQRLEAKVRELQSLLADQTRTQQAAEWPEEFDNATRKLQEQAVASLESFERLSINDSGYVSYHGPTSVAHLQLSSRKSSDSDYVPENVADSLAETGRAERRQRLVANALMQRTAELMTDTHVNGWYYSHALLSAILAHSARWCRLDPNVAEALRLYENGGLFFEHSRTVLHDDLREGRTGIPTVQALLLVSAQECGKGNWTQAWMYSGIAFRLLGDLGINVDGRKYMRAVNFSEEDIEIRNRLFWSCYFWDKIISLYLGRCPQIQYSNVCPPQLMNELNKLGINIDADFDLQGTGTPGKKFSMPRETPVPAMLAPVPDPSSEPAPFEFCGFGPGDPLNAASFCPN